MTTLRPFISKDVIIEGNPYTIKPSSLEDIIYPGMVPLVVAGSSGTGKTVIVSNIFKRYATEATRVFYITNTRTRIGGSGPTQGLHPFQIVEPTIQNIIEIVRILNEETETAEVQIDTVKAVLSSLMGQEALTDVEQYADRVAPKKTDADEDQNILIYEIASRMIVDRYMSMDMEEQSRIPPRERRLIQMFLSKRPKSIIIFDDVTEAFKSFQASRDRVMTKSGLKPTRNAFNEIITDIFTRGRHWNSIICFFIHDFESLPNLNGIQSLLLLDRASADATRRKISLSTKFMKEAIDQVLANTGVFNDHFKLYVSREDHRSPEHPNPVSVFRAELIAGDKFHPNPLTQSFFDRLSSYLQGKEQPDIQHDPTPAKPSAPQMDGMYGMYDMSGDGTKSEPSVIVADEYA